MLYLEIGNWFLVFINYILKVIISNKTRGSADKTDPLVAYNIFNGFLFRSYVFSFCKSFFSLFNLARIDQCNA